MQFSTATPGTQQHPSQWRISAPSNGKAAFLSLDVALLDQICDIQERISKLILFLFGQAEAMTS